MSIFINGRGLTDIVADGHKVLGIAKAGKVIHRKEKRYFVSFPEGWISAYIEILTESGEYLYDYHDIYTDYPFWASLPEEKSTYIIRVYNDYGDERFDIVVKDKQ